MPNETQMDPMTMDSTIAQSPGESLAGQQRRARILTGPVGRTLVEMAAPMVLGIAAIMLFQIVDTFFVGRLGARPLAAMGFTFPVALLVYSVSMGIGIGTTAVVARAIGEGDTGTARRLSTDAVLLAAVLVVILVGLGLATQNAIFRAMGASDDLVVLIRTYMTPWFFGVALLVIPMVGNSAIRASGDTKTPAMIMVIAGVVNIILDPLLIFGWGPFPRLELQGAAIATVISWVVTFGAAIYLLAYRERLIAFHRVAIGQIWASWRKILYVGAPSAATQMLVPVSGAVMIRIVAGYGETAVAAFGVGIRIESLALVAMMALSTALTPFVAQNLGAKNCDRLRSASRFSIAAAMLWGVGTAALLMVLAQPIARLFNDDPAVLDVTILFLRLLPPSYGLFGVAMLMSTVFVATNRPLRGAFITAVRLIVFALPLAYLGSFLWGLTGVFGAMTIANVLIGVISIAMVWRHIATTEREFEAAAAGCLLIARRQPVQFRPGAGGDDDSGGPQIESLPERLRGSRRVALQQVKLPDKKERFGLPAALDFRVAVPRGKLGVGG